MKKGRILIALDYSNAAEIVAEKGYLLGVSMDAKIVLLHVVDDVVYYASSNYDPITGFWGFEPTDFIGDNVLENIEKKAVFFLRNIRNHLKDKKIQVTVKRGNVVDEILNTAKQVTADIIVLGINRNHYSDGILVGNTSEELCRHSTVPIYLVPIPRED
jgi:nucleotide-binding universal stress UspA family protein